MYSYSPKRKLCCQAQLPSPSSVTMSECEHGHAVLGLRQGVRQAEQANEQKAQDTNAAQSQTTADTSQ